MYLREEEQILRVFRHHPTPFFYDLFKALIGVVPFLLVIFTLKGALSNFWFIISSFVLLFIFALLIIYISLIYWLDKLVVTNQRVVYENWKYLTVKDESEAMLNDIQDIQTHEKGVFSYFRIFDYGTFILETAASHVSIQFNNAPDPEAIRQYVYHIRNQ